MATIVFCNLLPLVQTLLAIGIASVLKACLFRARPDHIPNTPPVVRPEALLGPTKVVLRNGTVIKLSHFAEFEMEGDPNAFTVRASLKHPFASNTDIA
ncbi:hypothetical protein BU23DRAFT_63064 [Bimuria novae-zelandiae CBS 107.79]|uniref:Uncharacterized protein n=1 Tax=Bimuria novae-zelandiae CBS 107.79 TaxID=1447943 RepID=A0A6A5UHS5_9PLEO|nr:hypothetical protein BU23DRAFT_63064 [Bimuria novae-zelandiae CBS 107.79]